MKSKQDKVKDFFRPTHFKIFAFVIIFLFRIWWVYTKGILDIFTVILTLVFAYIIAAAADMMIKGIKMKNKKR